MSQNIELDKERFKGFLDEFSSTSDEFSRFIALFNMTLYFF